MYRHHDESSNLADVTATINFKALRDDNVERDTFIGIIVSLKEDQANSFSSIRDEAFASALQTPVSFSSVGRSDRIREQFVKELSPAHVGEKRAEKLTPITTKAAQEVYGLKFSGPIKPEDARSNVFAVKSATLKAAYPTQIMIRVDKERESLIYDCYEYAPEVRHKDEPLPLKSSVLNGACLLRKYGQVRTLRSCDLDLYEGSRRVSITSRPSTEKANTLRILASFGDFSMSRLFRLAFSFKNIRGIRLATDSTKSGALTHENAAGRGTPACLILHVDPVTSARSLASGEKVPFAVRRVFSDKVSDRKFYECSDWTPDNAASTATHHYIYGSYSELKELCAYLVSVSPRLASFLSAEHHLVSGNTLAGEWENVPIQPSPKGNVFPHEEVTMDTVEMDGKLLPRKVVIQIFQYCGYNELWALESVSRDISLVAKSDITNSFLRHHAKWITRPMRRTYEKLRALGVKRLRRVSFCLLQGIFLGHVKLVPEDGLDTEIFRSECCGCNKVIPCTVRDILYQRNRGAAEEADDDDWESSVPQGSLQCKGCKYKSFAKGLCTGHFELDTGSDYNHCVDCDGFGRCIEGHKDCRAASLLHCDSCGSHGYPRRDGLFVCRRCGVDAGEEYVTRGYDDEGDGDDDYIGGYEPYPSKRGLLDPPKHRWEGTVAKVFAKKPKNENQRQKRSSANGGGRYSDDDDDDVDADDDEEEEDVGDGEEDDDDDDGDDDSSGYASSNGPHIDAPNSPRNYHSRGRDSDDDLFI